MHNSPRKPSEPESNKNTIEQTTNIQLFLSVHKDHMPSSLLQKSQANPLAFLSPTDNQSMLVHNAANTGTNGNPLDDFNSQAQHQMLQDDSVQQDNQDPNLDLQTVIKETELAR